jgi:clan AA aspartic protease
MGLVYADIEIINLEDTILAKNNHLPASKVRRMTTRMMVDSGAIMMAINEDIQAQMGCPVTDRLKVQLADGSTLELDVVGPLKVNFGGRSCTVDALVLPKGTEPLFGAIPMEYMDLIIDPAMQILGPHPSRPIRPVLSLK